MNLLRAVLISGLLAAQAWPAAAADRTYVNPRYGTSVTYPDAVFSVAAQQSENGDGQRWTSPDGAELAVWGQYNALGFTPSEQAEFIAGEIGAESYRKIGPRWTVISGVKDGIIIYHRAEFGADDVIHSMEMRYPEAAKARYDRLVGRIADSLSGP